MQNHDQDDDLGYAEVVRELSEEEEAGARLRREQDTQAARAEVVVEAQPVSQSAARPKQQAVAKVHTAPLLLDDQGTYVTKNQHEEHILASMLLDSGAAPASFNEPVQVMVARAALRSMGLNPYTALRQCGFINGAFTVYGDLELAMVRQSGQLEYIREYHYVVADDGTYTVQSFANSNLHLPTAGAVCEIKRVHQEPYASFFDIARAKAAGLWGRRGPWSTFPFRMLQMRARSEAIKCTFSDVTQGVAVHEYDVEGIDRKD